ncbi:MAG TPA: hypothetical protein VGM85_06150, partial [Paraburkholderia sp.]
LCACAAPALSAAVASKSVLVVARLVITRLLCPVFVDAKRLRSTHAARRSMTSLSFQITKKPPKRHTNDNAIIFSRNYGLTH